MAIHSQIQMQMPEIIRLRRDFHQHPELGFREFRTQERIMAYLDGLGLKPEKMAGTGVKAVLAGRNPGRTILLRSDMDALPVTEQTGLEFASVYPGVMHACGHDGHMAMLLGAAACLVRAAREFDGQVVFCFQPNEEEAGAYRMIEAGVLENPTVDAAFGCHLWSLIDSGNIDVRPGPVMAASHYFFLTVRGDGGHAGFAHESVDPVFVSTQIIQAVQVIQTRQTDALDPAVIMFTRVEGGSSPTIIPDSVRLEGSIRFLYEGGTAVIHRFESMVRDICRMFGATYDLEFRVGNHLLSNDGRMTARVRAAAEKICAPGRVQSATRTMAGEDFSEFARRVPAAYAFIGSRNDTGKTGFPHHHPRFDIDEDVLETGTCLYAGTALAFLGKDEQ